MKHPLARIPPGSLWPWQLASATVAVACLASLPLTLPLRETDTLLDLVESGSVQAATAVLGAWTPEERVRLAHAVGLDYLMNPAYMNVLAIACVWASRTFSSALALGAGSLLAWLCWSVAVTNAFENVGLFIALSSGPRAPWPVIVAGAHYWGGLVIVVASGFILVGAIRRAT